MSIQLVLNSSPGFCATVPRMLAVVVLGLILAVHSDRRVQAQTDNVTGNGFAFLTLVTASADRDAADADRFWILSAPIQTSTDLALCDRRGASTVPDVGRQRLWRHQVGGLP